MASVLSQLESLVLSAVELREATDWTDQVIEDYLNIIRNLSLLAESSDSTQAQIDTLVIFVNDINQFLSGVNSESNKNRVRLNNSDKRIDDLEQLNVGW